MLQTSWKTSENPLRKLRTLFQAAPLASLEWIGAPLGLLYPRAPVSVLNSLILTSYYHNACMPE